MGKRSNLLFFILVFCCLSISSIFPSGAATQNPPEPSFQSESDVKSYFESIAPSGFYWTDYSSFIVVPKDDGNYFYFLRSDTLAYNGRCLIIPSGSNSFLIKPDNTTDVVSEFVYLPNDFDSYYRSADYTSGGLSFGANIDDFYALYLPPTESTTEKVTAPAIESTVDQLATIINRLDIVTTIMLVGFGFIAAIAVVMLLYKFIRQAF